MRPDSGGSGLCPTPSASLYPTGGCRPAKALIAQPLAFIQAKLQFEIREDKTASSNSFFFSVRRWLCRLALSYAPDFPDLQPNVSQ